MIDPNTIPTEVVAGAYIIILFTIAFISQRTCHPNARDEIVIHIFFGMLGGLLLMGAFWTIWIVLYSEGILAIFNGLLKASLLAIILLFIYKLVEVIFPMGEVQP